MAPNLDEKNGSSMPLNVLSAEKSLNALESQRSSAFLPQRLRLEWESLTVKKEVTSGPLWRKVTTERTLLNGVTGNAEPGELLAIMGPSGGGKTTLLNTLSRRVKYTSGKVLLNGRRLPRNFHKISAYVMQDDRLFEVLTPRELFEFSAQLRLPREMSSHEKKEMVEKVINKLKMHTCADTRVGGHLMRGLSGGERKRTAIGYELITNPSLLFLDEPTSGLDSSNAFSLLKLLQDLAREGHTVICTIHQPSSEIFRLFDKLTLLVKGEVAYFGVAEQSITFFEKLGYVCPTYSNPADFFMDLLQTNTDEEKARSKMIVDTQKEQMKAFQLSENPVDAEKSEKVEAIKRAPFYLQFAQLTKRGWLTVTRNPLSFQAKIGQNIILSLLIGVIYYHLDYSQQGISDRRGVLFFIVIGQVMGSVNSILLTMPLERTLLIREQSNGMYGVTSYFLGKIISNFPLDVFFPSLVCVIVYWMIGLHNTAAAFFLFWFAVVILCLAAGSFGILLGCMLPNAEVAVTLAPIMIIPFMLFAGFYIAIDSIPVWLRWIQYISLFKWGFQAIAVNEFGRDTFYCTDSELVTGTTPDGQTVSICPITSGMQVLDQMNLSYDWDYWEAIIVLLGIFVGFRVLALMFLQIQTKRSLKKNQ